MYEGLLHAFSREMNALSHGQLNCLPYGRALLDFFDARGTPARPLVVRCVIFGRRQEGWGGLPMEDLVQRAMDGELHNGGMEFDWPQGDPDATTISLRYRTLGFTHGRGVLGDYAPDGGWSGHLVVVANGIILDPTIGQLNDVDYRVDFDPPYEVVEADEGFLAGRNPIVSVSGGKWVYYRPYPDERTYEQSKAWTDPAFRQQLKDVGVRVATEFEGKPDSALHEMPLGAAVPKSAAAIPTLSQAIPVKMPPAKTPGGKVGRNAPCSCGSGKKYKKCCGR